MLETLTGKSCFAFSLILPQSFPVTSLFHRARSASEKADCVLGAPRHNAFGKPYSSEVSSSTFYAIVMTLEPPSPSSNSFLRFCAISQAVGGTNLPPTSFAKIKKVNSILPEKNPIGRYWNIVNFKNDFKQTKAFSTQLLRPRPAPFVGLLAAQVVHVPREHRPNLVANRAIPLLSNAVSGTLCG